MERYGERYMEGILGSEPGKKVYEEGCKAVISGGDPRTGPCTVPHVCDWLKGGYMIFVSLHKEGTTIPSCSLSNSHRFVPLLDVIG